MKNITYEEVNKFAGSWGSQTAEEIGIPKDYNDTVLNFIKDYRDKLSIIFYFVCQEGVIEDKVLRLFTCWCAREALSLVKEPSLESAHAIDVAEKFANDETNQAELHSEYFKAMEAVSSATRALKSLKREYLLEIQKAEVGVEACWAVADATKSTSGLCESCGWSAYTASIRAASAAKNNVEESLRESTYKAVRKAQLDKIIELLELGE